MPPRRLRGTHGAGRRRVKINIRRGHLRPHCAAAPDLRDSAYTFPAPAGNYSGKLRFAEISLSGNSARVFNVGFNGTPVLTKFDIYAQAGALTALDKVAPPNVLERTDHAIYRFPKARPTIGRW